MFFQRGGLTRYPHPPPGGRGVFKRRVLRQNISAKNGLWRYTAVLTLLCQQNAPGKGYRRPSDALKGHLVGLQGRYHNEVALERKDKNS